MRAQKDLTSRTPLNPCQHLRKDANDFWVQRQLWLFEEQGSSIVHRDPKQSHQTEGPVGELLLRLPRTLRAPVLVLSPQMRNSSAIAGELDLLKLRHGRLQRLLNAA